MDNTLKRLFKAWWYERQSLVEDGWEYVDTCRGYTFRCCCLRRNGHKVDLQLNYDELNIKLYRDGKLRKTIT